MHWDQQNVLLHYPLPQWKGTLNHLSHQFVVCALSGCAAHLFSFAALQNLSRIGQDGSDLQCGRGCCSCVLPLLRHQPHSGNCLLLQRDAHQSRLGLVSYLCTLRFHLFKLFLVRAKLGSWTSYGTSHASVCPLDLLFFFRKTAKAKFPDDAFCIV